MIFPFKKKHTIKIISPEGVNPLEYTWLFALASHGKTHSYLVDNQLEFQINSNMRSVAAKNPGKTLPQLIHTNIRKRIITNLLTSYDERTGKTPLHLAAEAGNIDVLNKLIELHKECGIPLTKKDKNNRTAFESTLKECQHHKSSSEQGKRMLKAVEILDQAYAESQIKKTLSEHKEEIKKKGIELSTSERRILNSAMEVVEEVEKGVFDPSSVADTLQYEDQKTGRTALHCAALSGDSYTLNLIVKHCKENGVSLLTKDKYNKTALDYAQQHPLASGGIGIKAFKEAVENLTTLVNEEKSKLPPVATRQAPQTKTWFERMLSRETSGVQITRK